MQAPAHLGGGEIAQGGDGAEAEEIEGAATGEDGEDQQGVGGAGGVGEQQIGEVHAAGDQRLGIDRALGVDQGDDPTRALGGGECGIQEGGFAGGVRAEEFGDVAARQAAEAGREIEAERAGGDSAVGRVAGRHIAQPSDDAGSEAGGDGREGGGDLALVLGWCGAPGHGVSRSVGVHARAAWSRGGLS